MDHEIEHRCPDVEDFMVKKVKKRKKKKKNATIFTWTELNLPSKVLY